MSRWHGLHNSDARAVAVMNTPSSFLRVRVNDIPQEGLSVAGDIQPDALSLSPGDARFQGAIALTAEITPFGKDMTVRGVLTGTPVRQCVRCLKDYEAMLRLPFAVAYRRDGRSSRNPADAIRVDRREEDDEVYVYAGDWVELAEMLREQIILATPMQPLCKTDCPGLCPVCGIDLNERRCDCPSERGTSPFHALRGLFDTPEQSSPRAEQE